MTMLKARIQAFFQMEAASGILLIAASVLALICANTALVDYYQQFLSIPGQVRLGDINVEKPLLLWVNDGLMAVFFFGVGLELKHEFLRGHLTKPSQLVLPGVAALGGIVVPALIYVAFNYQDPYFLQGWAIPSATDIAFALGIIALLGSRVPPMLKVFVMTLAVLDDLGAVIIIALFYTSDLSTRSLAAAAVFTLLLFAMNRLKVRNVAIYVLLGLGLWTSVLKSGVHATLAGIILALSIPMDEKPGEAESPADRMMHGLHPWIGFGIVPIFAFANAGVSLTGLGLSDILHPVPVGIALGLFLGKQLGVFGFAWLMIRLKWAELPAKSWAQLYGAALLCGIGFTMSLFISSLAFAHSGSNVGLTDRLGILAGSLFSAVGGYLVLYYAAQKQEQTVEVPE